MISVVYTITNAQQRDLYVVEGRRVSSVAVQLDEVELGETVRQRIARAWTVDVGGRRVLATTNVQTDPTRKRGFEEAFSHDAGPLARHEDRVRAAIKDLARAVEDSIASN